MYTLKIYLPVKPNFTTTVRAGEWKIRWMNPWGFSSGGFSILIPGELGNSESSDGNQPVRNRQPSTPKGFLWLTYSVWDDGHWSLLPSMNWFLKTIHPWLYANKLESWSPLCRIRLLSCQPPSMAYIVDTHKHWFQLTPTHSLTHWSSSPLDRGWSPKSATERIKGKSYPIYSWSIFHQNKGGEVSSSR